MPASGVVVEVEVDAWKRICKKDRDLASKMELSIQCESHGRAKAG